MGWSYQCSYFSSGLTKQPLKFGHRKLHPTKNHPWSYKCHTLILSWFAKWDPYCTYVWSRAYLLDESMSPCRRCLIFLLVVYDIKWREFGFVNASMLDTFYSEMEQHQHFLLLLHQSTLCCKIAVDILFFTKATGWCKQCGRIVIAYFIGNFDIIMLTMEPCRDVNDGLAYPFSYLLLHHTIRLAYMLG